MNDSKKNNVNELATTPTTNKKKKNKKNNSQNNNSNNQNNSQSISNSQSAQNKIQPNKNNNTTQKSNNNNNNNSNNSSKTQTQSNQQPSQPSHPVKQKQNPPSKQQPINKIEPKKNVQPTTFQQIKAEAANSLKNKIKDQPKFNLEDLKLPPGITITKVDGPSLPKKTPPAQNQSIQKNNDRAVMVVQTSSGSNNSNSNINNINGTGKQENNRLSHAVTGSNVIVVDTGRLKEELEFTENYSGKLIKKIGL